METDRYGQTVDLELYITVGSMEQPLGDRCVFALRGVWFADRLLPRRDPCHPTKCFPPPNMFPAAKCFPLQNFTVTPRPYNNAPQNQQENHQQNYEETKHPSGHCHCRCRRACRRACRCRCVGTGLARRDCSRCGQRSKGKSSTAPPW
jgi:hypothetical protein